MTDWSAWHATEVAQERARIEDEERLRNGGRKPQKALPAPTTAQEPPEQPDEYIEPPKRVWGRPAPVQEPEEAVNEDVVRAILDKLIRGAMQRGR